MELKLPSKELQKQIFLKPNFKIVKTLLKLIKQKEGFETKILPLVSLDLDKRLRNGERLNIRG